MERTGFGAKNRFGRCLGVVVDGSHVVRFGQLLSWGVRRISRFALECLTADLMFLTHLQGIMLLYTISKQQLHFL